MNPQDVYSRHERRCQEEREWRTDFRSPVSILCLPVKMLFHSLDSLYKLVRVARAGVIVAIFICLMGYPRLSVNDLKQKTLALKQKTLDTFQSEDQNHLERLRFTVPRMPVPVSGEGQYSLTPEEAYEVTPPLVHAAIKCDDEEVLNQLALDPARVDVRDSHGETALSWAVRRGCRSVVQKLLHHGANVHSQAHNGFSPITWARLYQRYDLELMMKQYRLSSM